MSLPTRIIISPRYDFTRCMLCGCPTVTAYPAWLDATRIFFQDHGVARLSGPYGVHRGVASNEQPEPEQDNTSEPDYTIEWNFNGRDTRQGANHPANGRFSVHEQCWQFMERVLARDEIALENLYWAFLMFPPPKGLWTFHPLYFAGYDAVA
ncbi:hypothetical protein BJX70DRAFT_394582 [Aspergillus crustosus]